MTVFSCVLSRKKVEMTKRKRINGLKMALRRRRFYAFRTILEMLNAMDLHFLACQVNKKITKNAVINAKNMPL